MKINTILMDENFVPRSNIEYETDDSFFKLGSEIDELFIRLLGRNKNIELIKRLRALATTHLEQSLLYIEKAVRLAGLNHIEDV